MFAISPITFSTGLTIAQRSSHRPTSIDTSKIEKDEYLWAAIKYVERNPVRAKLAKKVEAWRWGSGHRRLDGTKKEREILTDLPIELPRNLGMRV